MVEIISPSDRADRVLTKIHDWLRAGVRLLWYVNPETGVTTVCHDHQVTFVGPDELLDGADVLPGLQLPLRDLLEEITEQGTA